MDFSTSHKAEEVDRLDGLKMGVGWKEVERLIKPVPSYEVLIKRLLDTASYNFVQETYNHSMKKAREYAAKLLGSDPKHRYGEYLEKLDKALERLGSLNVESYWRFIQLVENRMKAERFCDRAKLGLDDLIRVLKYLLFWVLPTKMYLRELMDKKNPTHMQCAVILREGGIRFTLDILEKGRTSEGREKIARETGIPLDFISELVNRADFTRMPYVSGKTVSHYFGGGYRSLTKLAEAELSQLTKDMARYFDSIGMKLRRSFIELDSGIAIARVLTKIVI